LAHPGLLRSGASHEEEERPLPGDELVPDPNWEATRAITIDATPAKVWPWVAQMGYGRGGWYGWNPLEREDTGVSELLKDVPSPKVGDVWLDGPGCDETKGAFTVTAIEPPRTLVLHSARDPVTGREVPPAQKPRVLIDTAWAFRLDPIEAHRTRLLARTRIRTEPRWAALALKWMGAGDTVMQRRLLEGIKARVEASPSPRTEPSRRSPRFRATRRPARSPSP
jgi:hypothetical protein